MVAYSWRMDLTPRYDIPFQFMPTDTVFRDTPIISRILPFWALLLTSFIPALLQLASCSLRYLLGRFRGLWWLLPPLPFVSHCNPFLDTNQLAAQSCTWWDCFRPGRSQLQGYYLFAGLHGNTWVNEQMWYQCHSPHQDERLAQAMGSTWKARTISLVLYFSDVMFSNGMSQEPVIGRCGFDVTLD